jgi:hypothetical protein
MIDVRHFAGLGFAPVRDPTPSHSKTHFRAGSLGLEDIYETKSAVEGAAPDNPILVALRRDKPTRQ